MSEEVGVRIVRADFSAIVSKNISFLQLFTPKSWHFFQPKNPKAFICQDFED
ncbi:MAG: hypothetical protein F6K17_19620 [Okeania sp. SIO3C4]|nr:hypothetical protein [Okeania sp. SIO3C4]